MVLYVHRNHKISGLLAIASLNQPELAALPRERRSPKLFDRECKKRRKRSKSVRRSLRSFKLESSNENQKYVNNRNKYKLIIKQKTQAKEEQLHKVLNNMQNWKVFRIEIRALSDTSGGRAD